MYPYSNYSNQQVTRVNGEAGARTYQMLPNSSALLLDETNPLVWLAVTDGAGYKTVTPYKIEPYTPDPEPNYKELSERIERLEERINESYTTAADRQQSEQYSTADSAAEESEPKYYRKSTHGK